MSNYQKAIDLADQHNAPLLALTANQRLEAQYQALQEELKIESVGPSADGSSDANSQSKAAAALRLAAAGEKRTAITKRINELNKVIAADEGKGISHDEELPDD